MLRSARSRFEAALFVLALALALAGGFGAADETVANTLYFAAWCAALGLLFSLGLRLPLHLRGRYASIGAGVVVAGAVGLGLLANIALYRHDAHFDVTLARRYTAPTELQSVARGLDRDVAVTYFYNSQDSSAVAANNALATVARRDRRLRFRALDLDKELVAAREYGVRTYNTAVIEADGRRTDVDNTTDLRDVAFAIERVLKQRTPIVCFVTGHGEPYATGHVHMGHTETLEGPAATLEAPTAGVDRLKLAIEAVGYSDRALATPSAPEIPSDCAVVADIAPRTGYSPEEVRLFQGYLARGGRLLLMYDPEFPVTPELQAMLGTVGVEVGNGIVADPINHAGTEQDKVAVPYFPPHPITDQIALTVFPAPRPLRLIGKTGQIQTTALAATSRDSYVQAGATRSATLASAEPLGSVGTAPDQRRGPAVLAAAVEGNWPGGESSPFRLVVVGSASFASNAFFPYASNGALAVSMVRWLAGDTGTPKLKPISYSTPEVVLTHREMQLTFVVIEVLLPFSVILLGILVWRRRR